MDSHFTISKLPEGGRVKIDWNASHQGNVPWLLWKTEVDALTSSPGGVLQLSIEGRNRQRPAEWSRWVETCAPLFEAFEQIEWHIEDPELRILFECAGSFLLEGQRPSSPVPASSSEA